MIDAVTMLKILILLTSYIALLYKSHLEATQMAKGLRAWLLFREPVFASQLQYGG